MPLGEDRFLFETVIQGREIDMIDIKRLKGSSYFSIIPLGMVCKLSYNENGVLDKVDPFYESIRTGEQRVSISKDAISNIASNSIVPLRLRTLKGNVTITGVLTYDGIVPSETGQYPYCVYSDVERMLRTNPHRVKFDAVCYEGPKFSSIFQQNSKLTFEGFDVVPFNPMSSTMKDQNVESIFTKSDYPLISGLFIEGANHSDQFIDIFDMYTYSSVGSVDRYVTEHGAVIARIKNKDGNVIEESRYSDVVKYNIVRGSRILYIAGKDNSILWSNSEGESTGSSDSISCEFCGKTIEVKPNQTYTSCSDPHCGSHNYSKIKHMLDTLGLESIDFDLYKKLYEAKCVVMESDLLTLEPYSDMGISVDLGTLIDAAMDSSIARPDDLFQRIVSVAGSFEAMMYYIDNPSDIATDLGFKERYMVPVIEWFEDPYNNLLIKTLIDMENIEIVSSKASVDGVPLFRDKRICVTGHFKNGSIAEIIDILGAYSADVVVKFDRNCDCVLIGGNGHEDVETIRRALSSNVPIYQEVDFFRSYGIDKDIEKAESPSLD